MKFLAVSIIFRAIVILYMLKRLVFLILIIAAASFTHFNYGEAAQVVYIEPYQTIVTTYQVIPLDNVSIAQSNQSPSSNQSSSTPPESSQENSTLLNMQVNLSADCNGIHVYVSYNNEPLEAADVSIYRIPRIPDYFELANGRTDASGFFSFNTSESEVGMIVSKDYFQSQEMKFGVPSINCTPADSKAEVNTTLPPVNETGLPQNETNDGTQINETKNTTANDSGHVPAQQPPVQQSSEARTAGQLPAQSFATPSFDWALPALLLAAAAAAYMIFGRGRVSVDPMPPPKGKGDNVSVDPMPPPKGGKSVDPMPPPKGKGGNVSVDPMPPPKV